MNNEDLKVTLESIPTPNIETMTKVPEISNMINDSMNVWIPDMNGIFHAGNMEALVHVFPKLGVTMLKDIKEIGELCTYFSSVCSDSSNQSLSSSYAKIGTLAKSTSENLWN